MDGKIILGIVGVISSAIVATYGWLIKHLYDKVVFEDTCEARRDCFESKVDDLKEYSKERFDRIEDLIKNGQRGN